MSQTERNRRAPVRVRSRDQYKLMRRYFDGSKPVVVKQNITLKQAKSYYNMTAGDNCFYGYELMP